MSLDRPALLQGIVKLAREAGDRILTIYHQDFDIKVKDDSSPVTEADEAAEAIILKGLAELTPDIPVLAEEAQAAGKEPDLSGGVFWLVDPLDGTREFINKRGDFTVNIALVEHGVATMGVIHVPARETTYFAEGRGRVWRQNGNGAPVPIAVRTAPEDGLVVVASRSHRTPETDAYIEKFKVKELISAGSSLKLCLVAEGKADLYPRFGRTMEWDIGAGQAILEAAGGTVETVDGAPLRYGKAGYDNPFFIAKGRL